MEDLFNFNKKEITKTNEKGDIKASKKEKTRDLKISNRDNNFKAIMKNLGGFPNTNEYQAIKTNGTSENPRIENFLILNDVNLFKHHKDWMSELTDLE